FGPMRLAARRLRTYSCRLTPISSERVRKASSSHVGSRRNTAGYVIYLLRNGTKASGLRNREYDDDCGISASTLILAWDLKSGSPKPSAARLSLVMFWFWRLSCQRELRHDFGCEFSRLSVV